MKRLLLVATFAFIAVLTQAQLEEDFLPAPTGWTLSSGASFNTINGNGVIVTPGVGGNNPAVIGTAAVNKTSETVKVCFDINAYDPGLNMQQAFPANTFADVLFVNAAVTTSKDAEKAQNIYASLKDYALTGGTNCFNFAFPGNVTAGSFKVFISFHSPDVQNGIKYILDNMSISGVAEVCGGTNCAPVALNDQFNRGNKDELNFNAVLYGSNLNYPSPAAGVAVDATGTDNDQNDVYDHLQWSVVSQPVNGSVSISPNGTVTVTRLSTAVSTLTFTYRLTDDGADNDFSTTTDNLFNDATVTVNWPVAASLPVSIINYTAARNGSTVTLQWTTTYENNNTGFEIQRSTGNGVYVKAGFVPTKASDGNSDVSLKYQFQETNNSTGTVWYRLVQIDKDATSKIYSAKGIRGMEESNTVTIYPNPGKGGSTNVLFGSHAARDITLTDMNGKVVKRYINFNEANLSINSLQPGIYMLLITNKATNEKQAHKIVMVQ